MPGPLHSVSGGGRLVFGIRSVHSVSGGGGLSLV